METILQVNAVKKHYGPVRVLRQCSLEIQAGEIYGPKSCLQAAKPFSVTPFLVFSTTGRW